MLSTEFRKFFVLLIIGIASISFQTTAQPIKELSSSEIKIALQKLNTLGSVLYIAAHPDDENTAVLSYFSYGQKLRTGYLALTRGDGGQNLIGSEQSELLGVIRTQELLAARRTDGAEQFFSRAVDFGYSKSSDETLEIWDKQKILSDVVWVIRKFKPDIIITRFPTTGEGGHGHHTASAILALEAFQLAADSNIFREQLEFVSIWQTKRIFWNAWLPQYNESYKDSTGIIALDIGQYNPLLGKSYVELAALSRTMHKSQGFGAEGKRGEYFNYFKLLQGEPAQNDLLKNIDLSWSRLAGSEKVSQLLMEAEKKFNLDDPSSILELLVQAYSELQKLDNSFWREIKMKELSEVIKACSGIWLEAIADDYNSYPGGKIHISTGIVNRSKFPITLKNISLTYSDKLNDLNIILLNGKFKKNDFQMMIPETIQYSQPYWLVQQPTKGSFNIENQVEVGMPENPSSLTASFILNLSGTEITYKIPVLFRWVDQVEGEKYRTIEITPPVTVNIKDKVFLFADDNPKQIEVSITNHKDSTAGKLSLNIPAEWKIEPHDYSFSLIKKNEEKSFSFKIYPPVNEEIADVAAIINIEGKVYSKSLTRINYSHIPIQTLLPEANSKFVRLHINKTIQNIGYIMGSGDEIPDYLRQLGYNCTILTDADIEQKDLSLFDVIISGIRAYNTRDQLINLQPKILDYIFKGGTFLSQYNTNRDILINPGPYPFNISRERVTVEDSPVNILTPNHIILNTPNEIKKNDFDNWIQERGLYFADKWDDKYEAILGFRDSGEKEQSGGVLISKYGKGAFIYTGLSFFRQIPAGVPGAMKLFINLISYKNGNG